MKYQYISQVLDDNVTERQSAYMDDIEALAHIMVDALGKMVGNKTNNNEQTATYVWMLERCLQDLKHKYFGEMTEGRYERMVLGKWSDKP